jgi:fatty-acyl-CoA synthase
MQRPEGRSLAAVLAEKAAVAPSHAAILFQDQAISYAELLQRADEAARALMAQGVGAGDRVGVLMGNEPDFVILAMATSMLGATLAPLNTWYKQGELAWTIRHAGLSVLVAARRFLKTDYAEVLSAIIPALNSSAPTLYPAPDEFPRLCAVVFTGEAPSGALSWAAFLREGQGVSGQALQAARAAADPASAAYILYTSGSTAEPKGVILNHDGVVANGFDLGQRRGITADDRVWFGTPLSYALGATNALPATVTAGATLVLQGHFEAGAALDAIERTQASVYYATGNISRALIDHPDYARRRIGSLKKGNAGLGAEYKRLTLVEMGITGAVPAYGLTETYGNAAVGLPDDPLEVKLATDGLPLPGMEIIIVDPATRRPLPRGEVGLALVRGHTTPGYLDNPGETAKALGADGFFDTGDLARLDAEGRFIFHSRLKEVIKSGGINVSPIEVEQLIATHPDVRGVYVVGVRDAVKGELIIAFVDTFAPISERGLREHVKERAAAFKVPHHVFFRREDQLPRLASGKVSKYRLQEEAQRELGL